MVGSGAVVVHNWIVGTEAKIYRFKEMLQWNFDGTDGYYTSVSRKYLVYENTRSKEGVAGEVTWELDKQAPGKRSDDRSGFGIGRSFYRDSIAGLGATC